MIPGKAKRPALSASTAFKDETEAALDRGVFGWPFTVVDGEPSWGADRLDQVERWLQGGW